MLQFAVALILLIFYFSNADIPENFLAWFYALTLPTYYYALIFAGTLILLPLYFIKHIRYLIIIPFFLINLYLLIDIFVFYVFRFHINFLFINMFLFDFSGIGISIYMALVAAFAVLLLFALTLYLFRISIKIYKKVFSIGAGVLILLFIGNQFIHIWAVGFNQEYITRFTPYFPIFYPTTSHKIVKIIEKKYPALVPVYKKKKNAELLTPNFGKNSILKYPLTELKCDTLKNKKYNILFFILESWRSGMLDEHITPRMYEFAQKSYLFTNHLSGGNVTVSGLFTMMYGLHPGYSRFVQASPKKYPPALMRMVHKYNYHTQVFTSSNLSRFSINDMFFQDVKPADYYYIHKNSHSKNDQDLVELLIQDIKTGELNQPAFWYTFLTSSHHTYYYPDSHKVYTPVAAGGSFLLDKYADQAPFLNDYKNSLHYSDALFGQVVDALEESGKLDNTVIILTSDHGEGFNDNGKGYWGHGSNFTRYQTAVPLLMYLPFDQEGKHIKKRSAHIDIVPTLLKHV
ncbi:MAG: sulfatase-like hydrolase/transferase, partial [Calditrichia bacterium]|nr:sulfatase-like hydrolase/transferase [Calditrichia bacterium]